MTAALDLPALGDMWDPETGPAAPAQPYAAILDQAPDVPEDVLRDVCNASTAADGLALSLDVEDYMPAVDAAEMRTPSGRTRALTPAGRAVALALHGCLHRRGAWRPTVVGIAAAAGVSPATAWRWLGHFESAGLVTVQQRALRRRGRLEFAPVLVQLRTPDTVELPPHMRTLARVYVWARDLGMSARRAGAWVHAGAGRAVDMLRWIRARIASLIPDRPNGYRKREMGSSPVRVRRLRGAFRTRPGGGNVAAGDSPTLKCETTAQVNNAPRVVAGKGGPGGNLCTPGTPGTTRPPADGGAAPPPGDAGIPPGADNTDAPGGVMWRRWDGEQRVLRFLGGPE